MTKTHHWKECLHNTVTFETFSKLFFKKGLEETEALLKIWLSVCFDKQSLANVLRSIQTSNQVTEYPNALISSLISLEAALLNSSFLFSVMLLSISIPYSIFTFFFFFFLLFFLYPVFVFFFFQNYFISNVIFSSFFFITTVMIFICSFLW